MQKQTANRLTAVVGVMLAAIMGLSVILPALGRNTAQTQLVQPPTEVPIPTFPPPVDTNTISFNQTYLHPTGLFTVAQPSGWTVVEPSNTSENARVTMTNPNALSVIQVDVEKPTTEAPLTLEDVDARFTSSTLASSWSRYTSWNETGERRRENDRLSMDFELKLNNQTYVARQSAWTDGEWIYSVRVVTPENATEELLYVLDNVVDSIQPNKEFATTPFDWNAHFDAQDNYIIRYPTSWTLADSAPGLPASISGSDDAALRVQTEAGTSISDEAAASAWVEQNRANATVLSVQPLTRDDASGFSVAYSFKNVDGEDQSGLAVLLNGPEEKLYSANLRFPGTEIDLNNPEVQQTYTNFLMVMNSFNILPQDLTLEVTPEAAS